MLADLYHSPVPQEEAIGAAAIGSSEAIMLAGLAMKKNWQSRRKAAGLPYDKPNIVMAYSVQVGSMVVHDIIKLPLDCCQTYCLLQRALYCLWTVE
jgi:glutamate/tyrosine decarboxylase-like PLP-dependent enzyme